MHTKIHAAVVLGIISYCLFDVTQSKTPSPSSTTKLMSTTLSTSTTTLMPITTTTPPVIPNITYTCDGNGSFTLDFIDVSSFSHFVITHSDANTTGSMYDEDSLDNCTMGLTNLTGLGDKIILLTNCDDHVYLYAMNHSTTLSKIVGGASFHKYDLQCELPKNGKLLRVGYQFQNEKPSKVQIKTPDLNLTMKFLQMNSTEQSTFKIGEELKVDIYDNSAVKHQLKLKTCTSYSDENHEQGNVKLYDSDDNVHEEEIFGQIYNETGDIKVDLHAFRYPTSTTVYMQCMVYVCNVNDTTCGANSRRRRSTDNSVHAVDGSFSVIETSKFSEPTSSGQGAVVPWSMPVLSAATFITTYLLMKLN